MRGASFLLLLLSATSTYANGDQRGRIFYSDKHSHTTSVAQSSTPSSTALAPTGPVEEQAIPVPTASVTVAHYDVEPTAAPATFSRPEELEVLLAAFAERQHARRDDAQADEPAQRQARNEAVNPALSHRPDATSQAAAQHTDWEPKEIAPGVTKWVEVQYTQAFPQPTVGPAPQAGSIGLGTLTGSVGAVRTGMVEHGGQQMGGESGSGSVAAGVRGASWAGLVVAFGIGVLLGV